MTAMTNTELFDRLGEPGRMQRLAGYDLFHPGLRTDLDRIASHSAGRLHAPVSMVSILLDSAQLVIGRHGLPDTGTEIDGTPAEWSLCTQTVLAGRAYRVTDNTTDPLHADNPVLAMAGLRSYAGVPLIDDSGHVLGAHCVVDVTPRHFSEAEIAVLDEGAADVMRALRQHLV
ncbi:GAF domain-containing protein [Actinoplanes xinjiangensis]|uniref:GAF domain-containing protein n=1 Tax=Actinoplanes xinjiangensis TaxID=512350 RepID=UPI003433C8E7